MMIVSILMVAALISAQPRPEPPFTVFVSPSAAAEGQDPRNLLEAAEMVRKRIATRKRWFRTVPDRKDAQIVVEVESHRVEEKLTMWASTGTMRGEVEGATRYSITERHFLEARVTLLGAELSLKTSDTRKNGSLKGAASGLAIELERHCEQRYGGSPR